MHTLSTSTTKRKKPKNIFFYLTVLFLVISVVSAEDNSSEDTTEEKEQRKEFFYVSTSVIVILAVLVFLSILFELFKDKVEELTSEELEPIVTHLWQELTVLGFLSLLSFLAVKTGILDTLSYDIFGPENSSDEGSDESSKSNDKLSELVENVHMTLFFVMVIFIAEVLILVWLGSWVQGYWGKEEEKVKHTKIEKIVSNYVLKSRHQESNPPNIISKALHFCSCFFCGFLPPLEKDEAAELMEYALLRREFISPRDKTKSHLNSKFDFSLYLSLNMGETLGEIVEIAPLTWGILLLIFVFCYFIFFLPVKVVLVLYCASGYFLLFVYYIVKLKLDKIRKLLITEIPTHIHQKRKSSLYNALNNDSNEGSPLLREIEGSSPPFLSLPLKNRNAFTRFFLGPPPNRHQLCFWFDRKGDKFLLGIIRLVLILTAIYLGVLPFLYIIPTGVNVYWLVSIPILNIIPVFFIYVWLTPHNLQRLIVVSNIELMKNNELISKVIRIQKTKSSLNILKVIHLMKFQSRKMKVNIAKYDLEEGREKISRLDPQKRQHIEEVFNLFDKDNSGTVSTRELYDFFSTLGHDISHEEAIELVSALDTDNDGELSFDEFCLYLEEQLSEEDEDEEEIIENMFKIFDRDNSNSISTEEFKEILQAIGASLTDDEIDMLIDEIDEDGNNEIDMEEFENLVRKVLFD